MFDGDTGFFGLRPFMFLDHAGEVPGFGGFCCSSVLAGGLFGWGFDLSWFVVGVAAKWIGSSCLMSSDLANVGLVGMVC